jgi:hypothetical protein
MTPQEFVGDKTSQGPRYLPACLKDFHDQKRIFKRIQEFVENKKRSSRDYTHLDGVTWVAAHVYVIDFFLWFMALHGYTLQKSRAKVGFHSLEAEMKDFEARQLAEYIKKAKEQTNE